MLPASRWWPAPTQGESSWSLKGSTSSSGTPWSIIIVQMTTAQTFSPAKKKPNFCQSLDEAGKLGNLSLSKLQKVMDTASPPSERCGWSRFQTLLNHPTSNFIWSILTPQSFPQRLTEFSNAELFSLPLIHWREWREVAKWMEGLLDMCFNTVAVLTGLLATAAK